MPLGLKLYQQEGDDHFITFSCHHRKPYLDTPTSRGIFLDSLERTRIHYQFEALGYVVMPEHVHLLVSEPPHDLLSKALQALKISAARHLTERPFWQARYYDFNVFTHDKRVAPVPRFHDRFLESNLMKRPPAIHHQHMPNHHVRHAARQK